MDCAPWYVASKVPSTGKWINFESWVNLLLQASLYQNHCPTYNQDAPPTQSSLEFLAWACYGVPSSPGLMRIVLAYSPEDKKSFKAGKLWQGS